MKVRFLARLALAALLVLGLAVAGDAYAKYPDKPINMIIAFTAGGSSDVQARIMQKYWNKYSDQQWVFVYKPGAGGAIGFGEIANSRPDGYTIGGINVPHLVLQPMVQKAMFSIDSYAYICQVVNDPQAVVVRNDSKLKSVKDVFEFAKANPGKLKVGLVGPNSGHHLMFLDVKGKFDFPVTEVFYKGAADQNAALLGGEIDVMFGNLNDVMRSLEEMTVLGLAAEKRNAFLPDVATLREQGFDPPSDGQTPEDAYLQGSEQAMLKQAVSALAPRQQALLSLRYGDGYSYEQIADAMNLTLGTVKSALNRAKEELKAAVQIRQQ